jgi:hypothetical protein
MRSRFWLLLASVAASVSLVPSAVGSPATGPTAKCRDGTYSYSHHRRGALTSAASSSTVCVSSASCPATLAMSSAAEIPRDSTLGRGPDKTPGLSGGPSHRLAEAEGSEP